MSIRSTNPATGEVVKEYAETSPEEVAAAVARAHDAYLEWRGTDFDLRSSLMKRTAALLRERKEEYARLMALEMGKPVTEGRGEVEKCAWVCEYYAEHAAEFLASEPVATDASSSYIAYRPIGVVLAVMPWNFPFWQVFRFAAPALMAGNAGVLKHASNVPGCALAIEDVFRSAGFPKDLFPALLISSRQVRAIIDNPLVRAATLTGSTPAGQAVAGAAGKAIKKTVLELGGSDPYLVLEDADLEHAAKTCAKSRLTNGGQTCISAKRFVVVEAVADRFTALVVGEMASCRMGDPLDESTQIGPQARHDLRDELHDQVLESMAKGATALLGCKIPAGEGAFYPPSVLAEVKPGMPAYDDELFGPVAAIIRAKDEADAVRIANDSVFGLGAAVFTDDVERGERIARDELDAGCCFVNDFVRSDPRLPFGGVKESGYGRELAEFGIREFVNVKTVYVR